MKLHIHVRGKRVAELYCSHGDYVLHYLPETRIDDFVALTMPVRSQPWIWPREPHPFFLQHLPDALLPGVIRVQRGGHVDAVDLSLLRYLDTASAVGRVVVTAEDALPAARSLALDTLDALDVEGLLGAGDAMERFGEWVVQYLAAIGADGAPRFAAADCVVSTDIAPATLMDRLRTSRYRVRASSGDMPFLGFNAYHSMRVMERLEGVPISNVRMSVDGNVLVSERADVDAQGLALHGVEDACSLLGLPPSEKCRPSLQQVLDATEPYIEPAKRAVQREHIAWRLLANAIFQNVDWHAKHIALRYTDQTDVAFAPIDDLLTMAAYPGRARQMSGLSLSGRSDGPAGKALQKFFKVRLGISPARHTEMVERICEAVIAVRHEIVMAARNEPLWHDLARDMVHCWDDGMAAVWQRKKSVGVRGVPAAMRRPRAAPKETATEAPRGTPKGAPKNTP